MEYLHRLHTLSSDMILDPKWKEIFIASLPNWVTTAILNKLPGKIGAYKFGVIRQAIKAVIVELCSQMKVARAATSSTKPHGYQQLCKQWHLHGSKSLGGYDRRCSKKKAYSKQTFRSAENKKIIHRRPPREYKKTRQFHQRPKQKQIFCFHCNEKGHIAPNCPKLKKDKQQSGKKKQFSYKNKSGKVNIIDLPSSCEELTDSKNYYDLNDQIHVVYEEEDSEVE